MDIDFWVRVVWPFVTWLVPGGVIGWLLSSLRERKAAISRRADEDAALKKDVDELKVMTARVVEELELQRRADIASWQQLIHEAHVALVQRGTKKTEAANERLEVVYDALSHFDDEQGTYEALMDDIRRLPIWHPPID